MQINPIGYSHYNNRNIQQNNRNTSFGAIVKFEPTSQRWVSPEYKKNYTELIEAIANSKAIKEFAAQNDIGLHLRKVECHSYVFRISDESKDLTKYFDDSKQEANKLLNKLLHFNICRKFCSNKPDTLYISERYGSNESENLNRLKYDIERITVDDLKNGRDKCFAKIKEKLSEIKQEVAEQVRKRREWLENQRTCDERIRQAIDKITGNWD